MKQLEKEIKEICSFYNKDIENIEELNSESWSHISEHRKLSEDFIKKYQNKVDWFYISIYQNLSEKFIREFQDKVYWDYIFKYQILSEDFVEEFKDKLNNN